jgi:hypothetical protein
MGCLTTFGVRETARRVWREVRRAGTLGHHASVDMHRVHERLFVGAAPRSPAALEQVWSVGIADVLDLRAERRANDVLAGSARIRVHWVPTYDDWLPKESAFFATIVDTGRDVWRTSPAARLLVCCGARNTAARSVARWCWRPAGRPRRGLAPRRRGPARRVFVLAALVFSRHLLDLALLLRVGGGFAAFCAAASATYLFNDLVDMAHDREHPTKQERPLASGRMTPALARAACAILAIGAIALAALLDRVFLGIILLYLTLNTLYSVWLKHVVILDVMIIASGFVLRVLAGTTLAGVAPSDWLILCTIVLSLFLGFSKRRSEVAVVGERATSHRRLLADYSVVRQTITQRTSAA